MLPDKANYAPLKRKRDDDGGVADALKKLEPSLRLDDAPKLVKQENVEDEFECNECGKCLP